jgi:major membrane immunogen (membrane-anchored lipoprotein)
MLIEIETLEYDARKYGKPWIAKVTFDKGKPLYDFGNWIGDMPGMKGMLTIEVSAGDIIAHGQKYKNQKSNIAYYIVQHDGGLERTDKTKAYQHWKKLQDNTVNPLTDYSDEELLKEVRRRNLINISS